MNNIYKVIWSKAKNCYVVASEIARSHTKSASGSEKIGGGYEAQTSGLSHGAFSPLRRARGGECGRLRACGGVCDKHH